VPPEGPRILRKVHARPGRTAIFVGPRGGVTAAGDTKDQEEKSMCRLPVVGQKAVPHATFNAFYNFSQP